MQDFREEMMDTVLYMKWINYVISFVVFVYGFLFFYRDTQAGMGSLAAALLSAGLVFISLTMLRWLVQVFLK
jgi:hypothetical protein